MAPTNEPTDANIAECGKTTKCTGKQHSNLHRIIKSAGNMKANTRTIENMGREYLPMSTAVFMRDRLKMEGYMVWGV